MQTQLTASVNICGLTLISEDGNTNAIFILSWPEASKLRDQLGEALGMGQGMREVPDDAVEDLRAIEDTSSREVQDGEW